MEIRTALQKIENYLTVVSNLNKTILLEGTMSRDELLLMKKYLFSSIDRIEDIESLLVIEEKENKSFVPNEAIIEPNIFPANTKEIIEVEHDANIEEVEATMSEEQKIEVQAVLEEIKAEDIEGKTNVEIEKDTTENNIIEQEKSNGTEKIEAELHQPLVEKIEIENKNVDELKQEFVPIQFISEPETNEEKFLAKKEDIIETTIPEKIEQKTETFVDKFEDEQPTTFAEEIEKNHKEQTSLFKHLEQKLNTAEQKPLFEKFDDNKEEIHESFLNKNNFQENVEHKIENNSISNSLVVEKEVETIVAQLTPSSLNDIFKPTSVLGTLNATTSVSKSISESIPLNDKFIFVRELFGNQFNKYENGIKLLDTFSSYEVAERFCNETLSPKFNWNDKTATVERFISIIQKKFNE